MLPLVIAAAFGAPAPARQYRREFQVSADTHIIDVSWVQDEDFWAPVLESITNEQVRALNALLAIPYTNDHGFDYFIDE